MFPQIAKRKKKELLIADRLYKEWEETSKELDHRAKLALKKIPNALLHDFSKVCRIKSIPEFYANYFLMNSYRHPEAQLTSIFQAQIENILTHRSHFHIISQTLKEREDILHSIREALLVVQSFMLMSQGKNVPLNAKGTIQELVKGCQTLEELRELEKQKTEELAKKIIKMRENSVKLYSSVTLWRNYLEGLGKGQGNYVRKIKIIYPHQAINCLLLLFYDTQFIKNSSLKTEISFGKEEEDPFIEKVGKNKKGGPIQSYLSQTMKQDTFDYKEYVSRLKKEIPCDEDEDQKNKEMQREKEKERIKAQKEEKLKAMREEKKNKMERYTSLKNVRIKKGEVPPRGIGYRSSKGTRSEKKIINVDALLKQGGKKKNDEEKELPSKDEMKIIGVYQKGKKSIRNSIDKSFAFEKEEDLLNQKKIWQKEIKEEQQQKQKIKRLLKQTEKKALAETRQFEQKLKKYEEEVTKLKSRIDSAKVGKRQIGSSEKQRKSPQKGKKAIDSVTNVYSSTMKDHPKNSVVSILADKLEEESRNKKNLEQQIKELGKEKQKLEKTLNKESQKISKETQIFEKKLQKYEEAIKKLKNESDTNKKVIKQLESSKLNEESKASENLRMYTIKEKEENLKKKILEKIQVRERRKRSLAEEHEKKRSRQQQLNRSRSKSIQSIQNSRISNVYYNKNKRSSLNDSGVQYIQSPKNKKLQSQLEEEIRNKKQLERQVQELGKDKQKLEKTLQRESKKISRETQSFERKLEKYEEAIHKLKNQSSGNKRVIRQLQSSRVNEERKNSNSLRMYTSKEKQEELKKNILEKIKKKQKRRESIQEKNRKKVQERSHSRSIELSPKHLGQKNLEIVKTKQTIEIVFEPGARRKKKEPVGKDLREAESRLMKLQKQRELLQKKLELSAVGKQSHKKLYESRIQENNQKVDRFKDQLQKQRDRNNKLEQNIRNMRKSINSEFEVRLNRERIKYEKEREVLLRTIEKEKHEKNSKDKILDEQMKILKEMEKNEQELISMLNREKTEKKNKDQMLAQELEKKEELMNLIHIEEIKKTIERQIRKELLQNVDEEDEEEENELRERRLKMQEQIQRLREERDNQIEELDQQNQKLKDLISRIKGEENQLLVAIQQNIELESDEQHEDILRARTMSERFKRDTQPDDKQDKQEDKVQIDVVKTNEEMMEELKHKTLLQMKNEEKQRQYYSDIENSSSYKDKEKIQNLVEFYLKSPHQYPGEKSVNLEEKEKKHIVEEMEHKTKQIRDFQRELFSVKDLPEYVPQMKTDAINNHLLNLRQAYQDYEADSLRRELFPPLQDEEVYNEKELSVESEQPPIISIMDDVRVHAQKYSPKKKDDKKNFLAINRMRLMLLEDNKKQKQREIIEEESKKKIQREIFEKNRHKREMRNKKRFQKEEARKAEKRLELQKSIEEKEKRSKRRRKQLLQKSQQRSLSNSRKSARSNKSSISQHESENKSEISSISKHSSHSKHSKQSRQSKQKIMNKSKRTRSDKGLSESQTERDKQIYSDSQRSRKPGNKSEVKNDKEEKAEQIEAIKEEQIEHSLDVKEEEELQKEERAILKEQIKSVQSEVRSYISGEEQYSVYQQFVNEEEMDAYIDKLMELSSDEIKNLNGNTTLKDDYKEYATLGILVAKNRKGIQIGIGLFHKEYDTGEYMCDFILAHKMSDFLNLIFNFSKFIYSNDKSAHKIEYIFDLQYVEDPSTMHHFLQFQNKCRRMGEVYVKARNTKERKYILKRVLFQDVEDKVAVDGGKGIQLKAKLLMFDALMMEINQGFQNSYNINYSSVSLMLAYFLSKNSQRLVQFRKKAENQLHYRELLVTALLFEKKELTVKNIEGSLLGKRGMVEELAKIRDRLDIVDVEEVQEMKFQLSQKLPSTVKRCILEVEHQQISYLILRPEQAVTRVQSSNSSQTALFLSLIPKYKIMIIQAEQFLTMSKSNPELTAFFYVKHFIKNIIQVKKQVYERVYVPELSQKSDLFFKDASKREVIKMGWKDSFGNSVVFTPKHKDLVIQKPFIFAVLSGVVERAVEGSPICIRVVE